MRRLVGAVGGAMKIFEGGILEGLADRFGWWKTVVVACAAVVTAFATLGSYTVKTVKAFDDRYAKDAEVRRLVAAQQSRQDYQINDLKIETWINRRTALRDKKFDLEEKCRAVPVQCSGPVRQRIQELSDEIEELTRAIRALGGR